MLTSLIFVDTMFTRSEEAVASPLLKKEQEEMSNVAKRATVNQGAVQPNQNGNIVTITPTPKQERGKGTIQKIVDSIMKEEGPFYSSDYTEKFPPATVQGVFSILKASGQIISIAGAVQDEFGNSRVERGKYVRREVAENAELKRLREENSRLQAELAARK